MRNSILRLIPPGAAVILMLLVFQGCAGINVRLSENANAEQEYAQGLQLFKRGEYAEAHRHAFNAWSSSPDADKYQSLLGWTYLKHGNTIEADRLFTAVYKKHDDSIPALQGLAWVEYTKGRYPEAQQWFEKESKRAYHFKDNPDFNRFKAADRDYILSCISDADYGLGLTALAQAKYTAAEKHLAEALKNPNDFVGHERIRAAMGDIYYYQGNYPKALNYYGDALSRKNDPPTRIKVAWSRYYMGEIERAESLFEQAAGADADRRPALYGLVFTAQARNRMPESKKRLEELIRLDPYFCDVAPVHKLIEKHRDWQSLNRDFAAAYSERGEFGKAHEKLAKYLPTAKNDCEARSMEAWCQVYINLKVALEDFDKLAKQGGCPGGDALLGKGVALLYLGRLDEADTAFKAAIKKEPGNLRAKVAQGAFAFLKKDYPKAISIYTAHLNELPKQELYFSWPSHALNNLGWSYIYTGKYQEALNTFKLLNAYHPTPYYPQVPDGLGWAYLHLGRKDEAEKAFRQSLSLAPKDQTALDGLARLSASASQNKAFERKTQ